MEECSNKENIPSILKSFNGESCIIFFFSISVSMSNNIVKNTKSEVLFELDRQESHVLYKFEKEKPFTIVKDGKVFVIKGEEVEKLFNMTNFNTEESYIRFSRKLLFLS